MNASELHELVKDWPDGARPEGVTYHKWSGYCGGPVWSSCPADPDPQCNIDDAHAVLLHEASAVRWLADTTAFLPAVSGHPDIGFVVTNELNRGTDTLIDDDSVFRGPTLIAALDAAIRATK